MERLLVTILVVIVIALLLWGGTFIGHQHGTIGRLPSQTTEEYR